MSRNKRKVSNDSDSQYIQLSLFDDHIQQESTLNNELVEINSKVDKEVLINTTGREGNSFQNTNKSEVTVAIKTNENELENFDAKTFLSKSSESIHQLYIPVSYEDIVKSIGKKSAKIAELIVPVTEFEKQITQVVNDIKKSGYLLFLYGASGVGKSTFISSLEWRTHIPIKEITYINASDLVSYSESEFKLKRLFNNIKQKASNFFKENITDGERLCIVIEYLETLQDEDAKQVIGLFKNLNGLLRQYPILIVWPVTQRDDLDNMQNFAERYSSTMFHRRIPVIEFTGPEIMQYPNIAKKTIMVFNKGRNSYDFQLNDNDFENLKNTYENKPKEKQIIRDYLKEVLDIWEERTGYISQLMKTVPKPTEVWFVFCYPEAENVVARFAKQSPDIIDEMWNADYKALSTYITQHNQRKADWPVRRLTMALSGILTTKIMYLPTNALVSCIAAYAEDVGIAVSRESFIKDYNVPNHWFGKQNAQNMLSRTPLYLQLSNRPIPAGKRKSGTVEEALANAREPFEKINNDITNKKISDQSFNKCLYLTLVKIFQNQPNLSFSCEKNHPDINTRPDILVDLQNDKYICMELSYTIDKKPSFIADYVLRKLNIYMKQLEQQSSLFKDFWGR